MDRDNNIVVESTGKRILHLLEWILVFPLAVNRLCKMNNTTGRRIIVFLSWTVYICLVLMLTVHIASYTSGNMEGLYVSLSATSSSPGAEDPRTGVSSNLPEGTRMIYRLTNDNNETWECELVIGRWKTGSVSVRDDLGNPPVGRYYLTIEMRPPSEQPESVQSIIGKNGELLRGAYVKQVWNKEGRYKTVIYKAQISINP